MRTQEGQIDTMQNMPNTTPIISVCIPVYHTEHLLEKCLASVAAQKPVAVTSETSYSEKNIPLANSSAASDQSLAEKIVPQFEIVIVNDGSTGHDEQGRDCERIIKDFEKSLGKKRGLFAPKKSAEDLPPAAEKITRIEYISHGKNRGLVEARRTLVEAASGDYICMLDSDDTLTENALALLYDAAVTSGADIVHAKAKVVSEGAPPDADDAAKKAAAERQTVFQNRAANVHIGFLRGQEIIDGFLLQKNHNAMLCGKLIKRELYAEAFSRIPITTCTMAEDVLQYFWIMALAESYYGFDACVYNYYIDEGITSNRRITDLGHWQKICEASSVFTSIFSELENETFERVTEKHIAALQSLSTYYVVNNYRMWKAYVDGSIKTDAYEMLCDFWGRELVERVARDLEFQTTNGH